MRKAWRLILLTTSAMGLLAPASSAVAAEAPGNVARGKVVYERFCLSCHGELGNGEGEVAEWIDPKPRDYRQGTFKWRSTPSGSLPLVSDLQKTIEDGVYGTYMPTWYAIGHRNRLDVIAYIQTFSPRWQTEKPQPPIVIPPDPGYNAASVQRGRALYDRENCAQCHGPNALGDGPSAHELKNDWGYLDRPLRPDPGPHQVRRHRAGYLSRLHDRPERHTDAGVRRFHQARRGVGPGSLYREPQSSVSQEDSLSRDEH